MSLVSPATSVSTSLHQPPRQQLLSLCAQPPPLAPTPVPTPITPIGTSASADPFPSGSYGSTAQVVQTRTANSSKDSTVCDPTMPTTPVTRQTNSFYLADLELPSPSFASPGYARCSSEPPAHMPDMSSRVTRSRSVSRTPSLPTSPDESPAELKSLPITVLEPASFLPGPRQLPHASPPTSPFEATPALPRPRTPSSVTTSLAARGDSAPVTPSTSASVLPSHGHSLSTSSISSMHPPQPFYHNHHHHHLYSYANQHAALRSTQYTDLFHLEPHEYDSITDGELVRLYDRGVIDGRVLEQIVDASIRIQRACTDADRAVSIKTRRAMIRHALEE